ncbi:MAG: 7TM-DISM domain-containing protein [Leptospirales bacterium]|nr:7TM-DISM domain-containing protein [Leptospirales bacterium]
MQPAAALPPRSISLQELNQFFGVSLEGPWEMYWGRYVSQEELVSPHAPLPDAILAHLHGWSGMKIRGKRLGSFGRATYRMRLALPDSDLPLGLRLVHQTSCARLFNNGQLVAEQGFSAPDDRSCHPDRQDLAGFFQNESRNVDLILYVENDAVYNGGARGQLLFGRAAVVRRQTAITTAIELTAFGMIVGAGIYHVLFFLLHRKEYAFLFFGVVCFLLSARIPFVGTKIASEIWPHLGWEAAARILATLNILAPPVAIAVWRSLFPDAVRWRTIVGFSIAGALGCLLHLGNLHFLTVGHTIYVSIMFPAMSAYMLLVAVPRIRRGTANMLMAAGVALLAAIGSFAFFQNWRGGAPATTVLAAFILFVFFQTIAMARYHVDAVQSRSALSSALRDSEETVATQREELQVALHDHLGGALTDLQIHTERQISVASPTHSEALEGIRQRIVDAVRMFRSQLLFMEDLSLSTRETLPGIQMNLLRRYADAGRELEFEADLTAAELLRGPSASFNARRTLDLFFLFNELCTNDLKHGRGESSWNIRVLDQMLLIEQANESSAGEPVENDAPRRAAERAARLAGRLQSWRSGDRFCVRVILPLRAI